MRHIHRDIWIFLAFMVLLFVAWVMTGGPERAKESGDAANKFQEPLAPLGSGQTYNQYRP